MTDITTWDKAPSGTYSSFANDERCYEVHYITADNERDVFHEITLLLVKDKSLIDYDIHWDSTIEKWVGITCRDL